MPYKYNVDLYNLGNFGGQFWNLGEWEVRNHCDIRLANNNLYCDRSRLSQIDETGRHSFVEYITIRRFS